LEKLEKTTVAAIVLSAFYDIMGTLPKTERLKAISTVASTMIILCDHLKVELEEVARFLTSIADEVSKDKTYDEIKKKILEDFEEIA